MRILFLDWGCFGKTQAKQVMEAMHHRVFFFAHKDYQEPKSDDFLKEASAFIRDNRIDTCFSFNYYPVMAEAAHEAGVKYISFLYDSPYVYIYAKNLSYETNHVFIFDGALADELIAAGHSNVHYMLLPADETRLAQIKKGGRDPRLDADVSFVGAMYNEAHNFYDVMYPRLPEYLQGYVTGAIKAQSKVYGVSLLDALMTDEIVSELQKYYPVAPDEISAEPKSYRYANYVLARKLTGQERLLYMTLIGQYFKGTDRKAKLYTLNADTKIENVTNLGIATYEDVMPMVFAQSKINLNISLRSIRTGVPLRCMDIFSSGGFLLTNYQADMFAHFTPGEDFDYFTDERDFMEKVEYYLTHEKEREEIAANGYRKAVTEYSYEKIFAIIFDVVGQ